MAENSKSTSVSLMADLALLGTDLGAMFIKEEKGVRFLVAPSGAQDAPEVSFQKLMDDIKKISGGADVSQVETALKNSVEDAAKEDGGENKVDLNQITFSLKMAYLYVDTTAGETVSEYALNVVINTEGLVPASLKSIVDVRKIGIAVWNTTREKILSRMSIVDIDRYLGLETAGGA